MVWDAEAAKARILNAKGKDQHFIDTNLNQLRLESLKSPDSRSMHENYMLVASHVDEVTRDKILNHEYIDFAKLLHKDKPGSGFEDDQQRMMMVNKGGMSYWVPMEKSNSINNYHKWDQAFRVYLDIYTTCYPEQTSELIQYSHIIQMAAGSYLWDNVYLYDREFRHHMEKYPSRSWGVILQQAWTMFLKDRLHNSTPNQNYKAGFGSTENKSHILRKLCFSFNEGFCKFGSRCKFEHKCGLCGKFGHGAHNCRKAKGLATAQNNKAGAVTNLVQPAVDLEKNKHKEQ